MKKILLLGDSIRMGYDQFVKEEMPDYDVRYSDTDNGRFVAYSIWMFNQAYPKEGPFDYVHFNNGYWDCNQEGPHGEPQTPLDQYVFNLKCLIRNIRETGAIPVFATTTPIYDTPVQEGIYRPTNYRNSWIIEYNNAALELMKQENVYVNDLYSLILKGERYYKCEDSLHLTEEGYRLCAKQVAKTIRAIDKNGLF